MKHYKVERSDFIIMHMYMYKYTEVNDVMFVIGKGVCSCMYDVCVLTDIHIIV